MKSNRLINKHLLVFVIGISCMLYSCTQETEIIIPTVSFDEIEPLFKKNNDTVYIINFWATWCKPCLKELPDLDKLSRDFRGEKVQVTLISLDFPGNHQSDLIPFVREHEIESRVLHLTDTDSTKWIERVSPLWSGGIPATIIYKKNKKEFYEKSLTYDELTYIVRAKLKEK